MKYCKACHVSVNSPLQNCPLCYTTLKPLDNSPSELEYPIATTSNKEYLILIKILAFISISLVIISITINLLTPVKFPWSLILTLCIIYIWWAFTTAFKKYQRLGYNLMVQLISLGIFLIIVGNILNFQSTIYNYVFPALAASALLSFNILFLIQRNSFKDYFIYYLVVALIGFLPIILYLTGQVTVAWPASCCAVYSLLSILSMFIFGYRATKSELSKRFHL